MEEIKKSFENIEKYKSEIYKNACEITEYIEKYRSEIYKSTCKITEYKDKIEKCERKIFKARDDIELQRIFILDRLIHKGFKKIDLVGEGGVEEVYLLDPSIDIEMLNEDTYYEFFAELKEGKDYFILNKRGY
jgi:hypothetical protein